MPALWAGIDSGKRAHHCVVIDQAGTVLLSKRVENDENALLELIATIAEIAAGGEVCWATDLNSGGAALLIALLAGHAQQLLYIPGRIVHHAAATYRGDGKTDAKDARIIADQARMRTDLQPVRGADQISTDLRLLTARRADLVCDRVRAINRLRATLLEYFPALERAFDYSKKAPLILLGGYQTPEGIRRMGLPRLTGWLRKRGCRNSAKVAEKALEAANAQQTVLPTQSTGSALVARLAEQVSALDAEIAAVDAQITELFRQHDSVDVLQSMPGFGPVLAATFLANIGGDLDGFDTADRLASVAGLAPAPKDSGRITGNHHRPHRYNRRLMRTCYLAALSSLKNGAGGDVGWAVTDLQSIGNVLGWLHRGPGPRPPAELTRSQQPGGAGRDRTNSQQVERTVDRFMHQVPVRLIRKAVLQGPADLLRTPPLGQVLHNELAQVAITGQFRQARPRAPALGQLLGTNG